MRSHCFCSQPRWNLPPVKTFPSIQMKLQGPQTQTRGQNHKYWFIITNKENFWQMLYTLLLKWISATEWYLLWEDSSLKSWHQFLQSDHLPRMEREAGLSRCKLLYTGWTTTRSHCIAQRSVFNILYTIKEENVKKYVCVYVCVCILFMEYRYVKIQSIYRYI